MRGGPMTLDPAILGSGIVNRVLARETWAR
jgi:hypothetical protein